MQPLSPRTRALAGFAAFGVFWGSWGAALPAVQRRSDASDADLGVALFVLAIGALVSMRATGVVLDRIGPRLTPISVAAFGVTAVLPGLANSPARLALLAFLVGAASGAMDVAINADAVHEEDASGRPLLNLAHAFFSAAVVCSSLATGALRWAGASPLAVFAAAGAIVVAAALVMRGAPDRPSHPTRAGELPRFFQRLPGWLLLLGGLGAVAYWIENAWQSWGAVHLERTLDAAPAASALGPALFAAAMATGRVTVHRLARPGSERSVLTVGALVAGGGSALAAVAPSIPVALVGIVLAGAGCSVCAPTIVSLVGQAAPPAERGTAVGSRRR
ncbi:MAG: MFS transporter [Chloroflexota bacterium]|nr:MFS transporter [Chloroflexota bacterium]